MIETEHKGYRISYSDNEDVWRCWELNIEHEKLSKLKQRIDRLSLEARKEAAFDALRIQYNGRAELVRVVQVLKKGDKGHWCNDRIRVAVMCKDDDRLVRRTMAVEELYDPGAGDAYAEYQRCLEEERRAREETQCALDAIPRIDPKLYEKLAQTGTGEDD